MNTGAVLGVQGDGPAARFADGTISRIDGVKAFVIVPGFDNGLEFQANYAGRVPTVGKACIVALMTDTAEAWIISHDEPDVYPTDVLVWTPVVFVAGWSDYGGGYQTCQWAIDPFGFVHLRGLAHFYLAGTYGPSGAFIQLPIQAAPVQNEIFLIEGSSTYDHHFRLTVDSAGVLTWAIIDNTGNFDGAYMSIAGVTYRGRTDATVNLKGPKGDPGAAAGVLGYAETPNQVSILSNTFATATSIVGVGVVCDGSPIEVEVHMPYSAPVYSTIGNYIQYTLWEDGNDLGVIGLQETTGNAAYNYTPLVMKSGRLTPTAGPHTYTVKAVYGGASSGAVAGGGPGGTGQYRPIALTVRKA